MTDTPPAPNPFADATGPRQVLDQLAGAASVCWSTPEGAGVFDSETAAAYVNHAMARLADLVPGLRSEPELAQQIEITHDRRLVVIDGQPFPWFMADDPVLVEVHPRHMLPVVVLRVLADEVNVGSIGVDDVATLVVRDAVGALVSERRVGNR